MNYIKELNAFYDWLEINDLSASAINLWYALMHINNKAGWIETFTVAESVLCVKTGLTARTIRSVRNVLKQSGRIDFQTRKGGKPPIYKIIPFERTEIVTADNVTGHVTDNVTGHVTDMSRVLPHYINETINETKRNNKSTTTTRAHDCYLENFSKSKKIPQAISIEITESITSVGEDMVILAMHKALERNKISWGYAKAIIKSWTEKGIKTPEQAEGETRKYHQSNKQYHKKSNKSNEIVPDWFDKQQESYRADQDQGKRMPDEKDVQEVGALLASFNSEGGE